MRRLRLPLLLLLSAALAGAAAAAPRAAGDAQLAFMPLPRSAFDGATGLVLDTDPDSSGPVSNARAAEQTSIRTDSAASLAKAGRVAGYALAYNDLRRLNRRGVLVEVGSSVDRYRTAAAASKGIEAAIADATTPDPSGALVIARTAMFAVDGIGDEARGLTVTGRVGSATITFAGVVVRHGSLLLRTKAITAGAAGRPAVAREAARRLLARVLAVEAGAVTTPAEALPDPTAAPSGPATPKAAIASAALTADDVPGARVARQEYVDDPDAVASYERELDVGGLYGTSRLVSIENDVQLHESASEASFLISSIAAVMSPKNTSFEKLVRTQFSKGANGLAITSYSVVRRRSIETATVTGYEITIRLGTAVGTFDAQFTYLAVGRLTGDMYVVSTPGARIAAADGARLDNAFIARLKATATRLHVQS